MSRRTITFLALLILLSPLTLAAAEYDQKIEQFFTTLKGGKTVEALDFIYSGNSWLSRSSDQVQNVKNQMVNLPKLVGELRSYEKIQEIMVGSRYVYLSYLVIYDRQPLRFEFEFYRPADKWVIFGFAFDDKLDDEVEAAAHAQIGRQ